MPAGTTSRAYMPAYTQPLHLYLYLFFFTQTTRTCYAFCSLHLPLHAARLELCVANVNKLRLQARTTNEESQDARLARELLAVLTRDATTINDAQLLCLTLGQLLLRPLVDGSMNLLCLLRRGNLARSNGPDGLVGHDDLGPVLGDLLAHSLELADDDVHRLVGLALLEGFAHAEDDAERVGKGSSRLVGDGFIALAEEGAALGVAEDYPGDLGVLELRDLCVKRREMSAGFTVALRPSARSSLTEISPVKAPLALW